MSPRIDLPPTETAPAEPPLRQWLEADLLSAVTSLASARRQLAALSGPFIEIAWDDATSTLTTVITPETRGEGPHRQALEGHTGELLWGKPAPAMIVDLIPHSGPNARKGWSRTLTARGWLPVPGEVASTGQFSATWRITAESAKLDAAEAADLIVRALFFVPPGMDTPTETPGVVVTGHDQQRGTDPRVGGT